MYFNFVPAAPAAAADARPSGTKATPPLPPLPPPPPPPPRARSAPVPSHTSTIRSHPSFTSTATSVHHKVTNNSFPSKKKRNLLSKASQLDSGVPRRSLKRLQPHIPKFDGVAARSLSCTVVGAGVGRGSGIVATSSAPAIQGGGGAGIAAAVHVPVHDTVHGRDRSSSGTRGGVKRGSPRKDKPDDVDDSRKVDVKKWLVDVQIANADEKSDEELSSEAEVQVLEQMQTQVDVQERDLNWRGCRRRGPYLHPENVLAEELMTRKSRNKNKSRLNLRESGYTAEEERMFHLSSLVLRTPTSHKAFCMPPSPPHSLADDVSVMIVDEPEEDPFKTPLATPRMSAAAAAGPSNSHFHRRGSPGGSSIKSTTSSSYRRSASRSRRLKNRLKVIRLLGHEAADAALMQYQVPETI